MSPLQLGPFVLRNRVLLAPMAGVTDLPQRELAWACGAGAVVSEMVTDRPELWHSRQSSLRREALPGVAPHIVQIAGHEPRQLALAAQRLVDSGADIIDLNFGCPMKKVCRKAAGSALLAQPDRVLALTEAVLRAVPVPVTVKMRTGPKPEQRNAPELAERLAALGIAALTLHGRTRACRFLGEAEYDTIAEVKARLSIPVIANGDIDSAAKARAVLAATGADAVMIGRASLGAPWLPGVIAAALAEEQHVAAEPPIAERLAIARRHLVRLHEFYGVQQGLRIARKHVGWYLEKLPGDDADRLARSDWRRAFNQLDDASAQLAALATLEARFAARLAA